MASALLRLMRPANLVTAAADILAGWAAAGIPGYRELALLAGSSVALYAGGVVLNDVFDAELDAVERPERPIPSGAISLRNAALSGGLWLAIGATLAALVSLTSLAIAVLIALLAVLYDWLLKPHPVLGPAAVAGCRGLNLVLGISSAPAMIAHRWFLALIPFIYIAAITILSRGEVHGGSKAISRLTLAMNGSVIAGLLLLGRSPSFGFPRALPFVLLLAWRVLPAFFKASRDPTPASIRRAVVAGILSLIMLDAALAAGYAGFLYGLATLALSLVAARVARLFAVT